MRQHSQPPKTHRPPWWEVSKSSITDGAGQSLEELVRVGDDGMDVDSGQEVRPDREMLCQIEKRLIAAEVKDPEELREVMKSLRHAGKNEVVSEICTVPRVTALAGSLGLSPGFALDMTVVDPHDGQP